MKGEGERGKRKIHPKLFCPLLPGPKNSNARAHIHSFVPFAMQLIDLSEILAWVGRREVESFRANLVFYGHGKMDAKLASISTNYYMLLP